MNKPNVIILTIGSSNSTVVARMMAAAGWNVGDVDPDYAENREVHQINARTVGGSGFDKRRAGELLASLPRPWVLKDPKFSQTLRHWRPSLANYRPALLWLTKDLEYVRKSYSRRFGLSPGLADRRHVWCEQYFAAWPWGKLHIDAENMVKAIRLFDPDRCFKFRGVPGSTPAGDMPIS